MTKPGDKNTETSILDEDTIPNDNQSLKCFSCHAEITGLYCANCGQKNDDYRRSIFSLFGELFGSFTAIESRMWRTWATLLFKPGKVAREFADGARAKWSSPIRVFLAISILLFGFMSLTKTQLISVDMNVLPKAGITKAQSELAKKDLRVKFGVRYFQTQSQIDKQNKTRNFDLIEKWLSGGTWINIEAMGKDLKIGNDDKAPDDKQKPELTPEQRTERIHALSNIPIKSITDAQRQELLELTQQELGSKLNDKLQTDITQKFLAMLKSPKGVNGPIYKWLPRIMFFMMPIAMFIGIIFIRGRGNALLYDHLVHAAYIHSVAFFLVLMGTVLMRVLPGALVAETLLVILLIYLPLSLKTMFGRGWIKTIWASYGVGVIYAFTLTFVMILIIGFQIAGFTQQYS